jgi:hypothetical protein
LLLDALLAFLLTGAADVEPSYSRAADDQGEAFALLVIGTAVLRGTG